VIYGLLNTDILLTLSDIQGHSHIPSLYKFFGRPFVKRFALCYRTVVLSVLSDYDVGALWPNAWMDQDETWHAGRPRHWPHCVRWGPSSPSPYFQPICCSQMAGWIKIPVGRKVGLSPSDIVLDGNPAPPPQKGGGAPNFRPMSIVVRWLDDATWHGGRSRPRPHWAKWGPSSPLRKGHSTQFWAHICCRQMAGWIKMPLATEVGLDPSDIALDVDPAHPSPKGGGAPNFLPMSIEAKRLDGSRCHLVRK